MARGSRREEEDMAGQTSDELLALFDTARLDARYCAIFVIMPAMSRAKLVSRE
jgi:hypothetical protein